MGTGMAGIHGIGRMQGGILPTITRDIGLVIIIMDIATHMDLHTTTITIAHHTSIIILHGATATTIIQLLGNRFKSAKRRIFNHPAFLIFFDR